MRVVIVGLGEVGTYLTKILSSQEKYDVVGIDTDKNKVDLVEELYDVQTLEGYGAAPYILRQAEAENADFFIAVSNNDEVNLVAALIARQMGAKFTIARVSNPSYLEEQQLEDYETLGIDLLISPERRTALTVYQSIEYPQFLKVDTLGEGRVHINQYRISSKSPFAYKKIKDLSLSRDTLIVGITRKRDFLFPGGDTEIFPNDTLFIVAKQETMKNIELFLPIERKEIQRLILLGASNISYYLAKFTEKKFRVILIEPDTQKSEQIASLLDNTAIYNEDIFNSNLLSELLLNEHDYFIAATENDEMNLLSSVLLRDHGLSMVACILHRSYLLPAVEKTGIHQVFSPQITISNDIASVIRAQDLLTFNDFQNISAEFVEMTVQPNSAIVNRMLNQIPLPPQTLFVAVLREDEVFIPRGDSTLQALDKIIVLCIKENLEKIQTLFAASQE